MSASPATTVVAPMASRPAAVDTCVASRMPSIGPNMYVTSTLIESRANAARW